MNNDQHTAALHAITQASHQPTGASPPPSPGYVPGATVNWGLLDDIASRDEWVQLRAWVEWFTVRYRIPVSLIPPCWWMHGELVEELSALHAAHIAWFDPEDTGLGPITWHEHLHAALPRITKMYGGSCASSARSSPSRPTNGSKAADTSASRSSPRVASPSSPTAESR